MLVEVWVGVGESALAMICVLPKGCLRVALACLLGCVMYKAVFFCVMFAKAICTTDTTYIGMLITANYL